METVEGKGGGGRGVPEGVDWERLYEGGRCLVCGEARGGEHAPGCPGAVTDRIRLELRFSVSDRRERVFTAQGRGRTLAEAEAELAQRLRLWPVRRTYEADTARTGASWGVEGPATAEADRTLPPLAGVSARAMAVLAAGSGAPRGPVAAASPGSRRKTHEGLEEAILAFCTQRLAAGSRDFVMSDLVGFIQQSQGAVAPDSPSRILRQLRTRGVLQYELLSRADSRYRIVRLGSPRGEDRRPGPSEGR